MDLGGVKAQSHKMLWGEDLGPETPVDNPDVPQPNRPNSSQEVITIESSSESDEEEWKYVKGNVKPSDKDAMDESLDAKSQLNPNATEFVPGVPSLEKDEFIASSPNIGKVISKDLDDIVVPTESEFNREIATKACELEDSLNDIVKPGSRREIDFTSTDEAISDPVTLILNPHIDHADVDIKIASNPFAADMELNKDELDKANFVQDYFGKSDSKSIECVSPQILDKSCDDNQVDSQIPNSVSAEISSHFNFIDSHLDNSEIDRQEESEKERNQLEIKEPESPVNSDHLNNGVISCENHQDSKKPVEKQHVSENENNPEIITSQLKHDLINEDIPVGNVIEIIPDDHEFLCESEKLNTTDCEIPSEESSDHHFICESDKLNITDTEDMFRFESREDIQAAVESEFHASDEVINSSPVKGNDILQAELEIGNVSKEFVSSHFTDDIVTFTDLSQSEPIKPISENDKKEILNIKDDFHSIKNEFNPFQKDDTNVEVAEDSGKLLSVDHDILADRGDVKDKQPLEETQTDQSQQNQIINEDEIKEAVCTYVDETHFSTELKTKLDENKERIDCLIDEGKKEPHIELADTVGPNSFSFSQPIAEYVYVGGMSARDIFNRFGTTDIMMTSMHESFEPDSSFEFIHEFTEKDSNVECNKKHEDNIATNEFDKTSDRKIEQNGICQLSKIVSEENENFCTSPLSKVLESESVIVESHAMPMSSEPDIVFVEQICPTVEVRSDEASPVNKENNILDSASTALTAAGITGAATGAAVVAAVISSKEEALESVEKQKDIKPESKSAAAKTAVTKKTTAPGAKPSVPKTSTLKAAPAKSASSTAAAKPKAPPTTKPTASTLTKKPATSAAKPSSVGALKTAPVNKPLSQNAAAKAAYKPSTTTTTKSTLNTAKSAPRPASAPSKSSALPSSKPPLTSRTAAAAPKAPLAAKKPTTAPRPLGTSRLASASETGASTKPSAPRASTLASTKSTVPKTTLAFGAKPPTKLGISAAPAPKPKTTSPTKPAPIKAKAPLASSKKPAPTTTKKTSTVLDKNNKNAVKSVPRVPPQKDIEPKENKDDQVKETCTTNGHHFENGNVTPHEDIASPLII